MNKINWNQVLVVCLVILVVFLIGNSVLRTLFWGGLWGMMGPGMMHNWSNGEVGPGYYRGIGNLGGRFGVVFSIVGMLIPVGLIKLFNYIGEKKDVETIQYPCLSIHLCTYDYSPAEFLQRSGRVFCHTDA